MATQGGSTPKAAITGCLVLAVTSFFLHFGWEMWQVPFYEGMSDSDHALVVWECTRATLGDVVIAIVALAAPVLLGSGLSGLFDLRPAAVVPYLVAGLVITVGLEHLATEVFARWQYSPAMPRLPVLGTGLSPLLQWLLVPLAALFFTYYFRLGWLARGRVP